MTGREQLAAEAIRLAQAGVNMVDEHGHQHRHEVPAIGQYRLRSSCDGCDQAEHDHFS